MKKWVGLNIDVHHRKQAEEALRQSEEKYRTLFNSIDEGFHIMEVIFDEKGQPIDCQILEVNPAHQQMTDLPADVVGQRLRTVAPMIEDWIIEQYGQVALSGEPARFEVYISALDRWLDVYASRVGGAGSHLLTVVFNNVTERKRAEQRQAYLLKLSDALAPLSDPLAIQATVTRSAMAHFGADRCYYCEIEQDRAIIRQDAAQPGMPSVAGNYPLGNLPMLKAVIEAGRPFTVQDAHTTDLLDEPLRQLCLQTRVISFVYIPLMKNGQPVGVLCISQETPRNWSAVDINLVQDIAQRTWAAVERARAETALAQSERFVKGIITSLPLVIYVFDLQERRNLFLSPQVEPLFGYTVEQMQTSGSNLLPTFYHPDDLPRLQAYLQTIRASADEQIFSIEYRIQHQERGWAWVQSRDLVYQRDAAGRPTQLLGTAEDISDRKEAEEALQKSEKRFRLAIDSIGMGTWEWDLPKNEVYWNEQHFRLLGMEPRPNPISPDNFLHHVHPDDQERIANLLQEAIADRGLYDAEFCAVLTDGSQRWMSGYGRIVEEIDGEPVRMCGVMFDIDERRRAEDALRQADRRKDEFLAMLAHELRNPMATVRNGLDLLSLTGGADSLTEQTIAMMNRQVDHLVHMVDDLLDVSRISRGRIELKRERVELNALVAGAVEAIHPQYAAHQKVLHVTPAPTALLLDGDATRLSQVIANLLTNGLRYTGKQGRVWVRVGAEGGEAVIRVADNGIGLTGEQLTTIFELFVQVDNSLARSQGGLGVGLTLSKRLIELHGGRLEAHSAGLKQGSEFVVYLPLLK